MGPIERTLKPENVAKNPVNKVREDDKYEGHRLLEFGRTFINADVLTPAEREDVKLMLSTMIMNSIKDLAPEGDLSKVQLLSNAGPTNARLYRSAYGFREIGKINSSEIQSINTMRFDLGRLIIDVSMTDNPERLKGYIDDQKSEDILILQVSAKEFFAKLTEKGYSADYAPGHWGVFLQPSMFSPREFFSGNPLK
jgi:hypothetical protein